METIQKILNEEYKELINSGIIRVKYMPYRMDIALDVIRKIGRIMEPGFIMQNEIIPAYKMLIQWFHGDPEFEGSLDKGICLMGPTGSGKTLAMKIMLKYRNIDNVKFLYNGKWRDLVYSVTSVNEITRDFYENAYDGIGIYLNRPVLCIDDLGYELGISMRFGHREDVISFILGERYERNLMTFATTNLPLSELEKRYDDRTFSRMCGLFNFITLKCNDFRQNIKNLNL